MRETAKHDRVIECFFVVAAVEGGERKGWCSERGREFFSLFFSLSSGTDKYFQRGFFCREREETTNGNFMMFGVLAAAAV